MGEPKKARPALALSASAQEARMPPSPIVLLSAKQEAVEIKPRPRVPGKSVRRAEDGME